MQWQCNMLYHFFKTGARLTKYTCMIVGLFRQLHMRLWLLNITECLHWQPREDIPTLQPGSGKEVAEGCHWHDRTAQNHPPDLCAR